MTQQEINSHSQEENEEQTVVYPDEDIGRWTGSDETMDVSDRIVEERGQQDKPSKEKADKRLRRSRRIWKRPQCFKINAMPSTFKANKPVVREALNKNDGNAQRSGMNKNVSDPQIMGSWIIVKQPYGEKVMHTKTVLKRNGDENGMICKHKTRLLVYGKTGRQKDMFIPVVHYFVSRLKFSFSAQNRWLSKYTYFEKVFPNDILERIVYAEMATQVFRDRKRNRWVFKIRRSLYGLKEASRSWNKLLFRTLE